MILQRKDNFTKIRRKRVKDTIKHKDVKKRCELKRCLKMPVLRKIFIFFTNRKAYFKFFLTLQINRSFLFITVVSPSSKITFNPPSVYIKYNVNNKYETFFFFPFLSFSFDFYFLHFVQNWGKYLNVLLKHFLLYSINI